MAKNRSLLVVNEDFLPKFNAARASKVVFQQAAREPLKNVGSEALARRIWLGAP